MSKNPSTLYHYCSTESFLSIINNKSIWLSDIGKSNDKNEMSILRKHYYDYVYRKYVSTNDPKEKKNCGIFLGIAKFDGYSNKKIPNIALADKAESLIDLYRHLRVYCFCTSELKDSLGQWRGYANNGNGLAIGFSKKYLKEIQDRGPFCPISNFTLLSISYEQSNMDDVCEIIYDSCKELEGSKFIIRSFELLFHLSAFFKDKSFKEEKEWRIAYTINDFTNTTDFLSFKLFNSVAREQYLSRYTTPNLGYVAKNNDIISHIEVGVKDVTSAINNIIIGPKSNLTIDDVRQLLIHHGILKDVNDNRVKIYNSVSSYR